jgi:hypothetical protein
MKRTLIRYKTKPEATDANAMLIERVFQELKATAPDGVRYLALKLDDGTFVHFVESEGGDSPIPRLDSFRTFQGGIRDRCTDPPQASGAIVVGNYRMLAES